ncbi:MAG: outer membrane beta-barrel protein [Vicinamibacteria bacterium]
MRYAVTVAFLAILAGSAGAQTGVVVPDTEGKHSGAPLGQFTVGPIIVTPTFKISTLAVDTNVQYSRERRADFVAAAGPGLDIALPFLDHWQVEVQGLSQYFYFQRTKGLRRWTAGGTGTVRWATTGTRANVSAGLTQDFSRPSFEVDQRIATTRKSISGNLERDLGRLTLALGAGVSSNKIDGSTDFRGADLVRALTTDTFAVTPQLLYRLTPLTSLLFEAQYDQTRFPNASIRNFRQESAGAGFRFSGLLKGQVTAGARRNELDASGATKNQPYLRGNLSQQLGRRFRLQESYTQESAISAFAIDGNLPTYERKALTLELAIELSKRIDVRFNGRREKLTSDGNVRVVLDDGSLGSAQRDDLVYVAGGDIGIRLGRARFASFVSYTTRKSQYFSDFGIEGLLAGARVEYAPK